MKSIFSYQAKEELDDMSQDLQSIFIKHARKLENIPPRRHMRYSLPYYAEEVTKQARMIFDIEGQSIKIYHCFSDHKEYERWYKSYK